MNTITQKKRAIISELITKLQDAEYSEDVKRELTDELRVTLRFLDPSDHDKIFKRIYNSGRLLIFSDEVTNQRNQRTAFNDFIKTAVSNLKTLQLTYDLTEEFNNLMTSEKKQPDAISKTKIFIVHGHDDALKNEVQLLLTRLGLEPIVLHEQINRGQNIIDKFEKNADVGFAIVLYTPCDIGRSNTKTEQENQPRARQNVIFEHGYFVAKLGKENVFTLRKDNVEIPSDLNGNLYETYDIPGAWKHRIARELQSSGYEIDFSKIQ